MLTGYKYCSVVLVLYFKKVAGHFVRIFVIFKKRHIRWGVGLYSIWLGLLCLVGCEQKPTTSPATQGAQDMIIELKSDAFGQDEAIPRQYTGEGKDLSPPLRWTGLPAGTRQLALVVDDPDAPRAEPWVHWVMYNIPAETRDLPEGIPGEQKVSTPAGAVQGKNSWGRIGYGGPMPPPGHGVHHYYFKLYALDSELDLKPGLDKKALLEALGGHVLGRGELIGTYER